MSASSETRRLRADRVRAAQALAAKGASWETIARVLRVSHSTVRAYLSDPDGTARRRPREVVVSRCDEKRWTREEVVEALKSWFLTYGEVPATRDWDPERDGGGAAAERRARYRRLRRSGLIPPRQTALALFGTWNAALEAAGLPTRKPGGQKGLDVRTHCSQGHQLTEDNVYMDRGRRRCRKCANLNKKNWAIRKRARERGLLIG